MKKRCRRSLAAFTTALFLLAPLGSGCGSGNRPLEIPQSRNLMPASVTDEKPKEQALNEEESLFALIQMAVVSAEVEDFLPEAKSREHQERILAYILEDKPRVLALCFVSPDGKFVCSDGWRPDTSLYDPTQEEWYRQALDMEDYWQSGSYTSVAGDARVTTTSVSTWEDLPTGRVRTGVAAIIVDCDERPQAAAEESGKSGGQALHLVASP